MSITQGPPGSRRHIWTYSIGRRNAIPYGVNITAEEVEYCPCGPSPYAGSAPPAFAGSNWFCDSMGNNDLAGGSSYTQSWRQGLLFDQGAIDGCDSCHRFPGMLGIFLILRLGLVYS